MFMSVVMVDRHKPESDPVPCLSRNPPPHAAAVGQRSEVHRVGRRGPWQVPAYTVLGQHQSRRHTGGRDLLRVRMPGQRAGHGAEARHSLGWVG
jgi:hypothetical protein